MALIDSSAIVPNEPDASSIPRNSLDTGITGVAFRTAFWIGVFVALCGQIVTFVPGEEFGWFLLSAVLIATGMFVLNRSYRVAAIMGCALCLLAAYAGYLHGLEYEAWLRSR
jgi:hypothetical protein